MDLGPETLNRLFLSNTEKKMYFCPKMACKPGQHLLRAKSKTENFGLLALHSCYFFFSAVGCAMTNHWLLLKKQFHSSDVNHCIWAVNFLPKDE